MKRKNRKSKPEKANGVEETDNDTTEATQNGGEEKEQQSGDSVSKKRKNKKTGKQTEENGEQVEDKKPKGGKKKDKYIDVEGDEEEEEVEEEEEEEEEEEPVEKKRKSGGKKASKVADEENGTDEEDNDDEEYEVQAIIDEKMIRGVKHYLIRWKGYDADGDTWEPASTLNCPDALEEYKKKQKKPAKKLLKKTKDTKIVEDWDENEDFEVDRILEVHFRRDGKREFLVSWKGYPPSDSSWEPEENMSCKDLIQRFLAKVERAREVDQRELRVNRPATERFTLSAVAKGRRLSKRHQGKQRVQYHDAE